MKEKLNIPSHVAIIMDGNGRWATKRHKERSYGHYYGGLAIPKIVETSILYGVSELSLFAFSVDNFKRPKEEIDYLFNEPVKYINEERIKKITDSGVKLLFIGSRDNLPENLVGLMERLEQETKDNNKIIVNICINYSSKMELINLSKNDIKTEEDFNSNLLIKRDVDLLIRTGHRYRLSNFMCYQARYAEIYFTKSLFPDFSPKKLIKSFRFYSKQKRTFGGLK
jgi:undecaprenyl diphosphate synthase